VISRYLAAGSSLMVTRTGGGGALINMRTLTFGLYFLNTLLSFKDFGIFIGFLFGSCVTYEHLVHSLMLPVTIIRRQFLYVV
jgi:hypothetical protein